MARRPGRGRGHRHLHRLCRRPRCSTRATRVVGVRTGDRGIGKHGEQKPTFEPGVDIRAKVTIFCRRRARQPDEGAGAAAAARTRDGSRSSYAIGIKELWEVPAGRARAGTRHPHDGLSAADGRVRRRVHLRDARTGCVSVGFVVRPRLPRSDVRSAHRVPALQAASARSRRCSTAGRWCATARRRCPKAAGTRSRRVYMPTAR